MNSPAWRPSGPRSPEPGRASHANTIGCCSGSSCRCSSYSVSKVPIASCLGISAHSARTMVVFPAPWAPATTMLLRALTAADRKEAATSDRVPRSTRSSRVTWRSRWRRMTTDGRGVTQAAAASRAPPSRRRCSRGCASENGRALTSLREARKTRKSISSWSLSATAGPGTRRPSVSSRVTWSFPVMMMFSTRSSSTSGCSRPSPNRASSTAVASASCSTADQVAAPASIRSAASASSSSAMIARPRCRCSSLVVWARSSPSAARQPVGGLLTEHRDQGPVEVPAERARQCSGHRHGLVALSPVPVWGSW